MRPIGGIETGMARGLGRTWLCERPACGHETEVIEYVCQSSGFPARSWRGMRVREYTTLLDRNYWHPCIKGHVGQCRGRIGAVPLNARFEYVRWVGPGFPYVRMPPGDSWLIGRHKYRDERMAEYPHRCTP